MLKKIDMKLLLILMIVYVNFLSSYCLGSDNEEKKLIIKYFQNHGYKYVKEEYLDVKKLNRIPFLIPGIYKVIFLNYHPTKYFYFTIIKDQVNKLNTDVDGTILDLNILHDKINQRDVLNLSNAKKISIFFLNLINSGYPDKIIRSKEEIIKEVKPDKLKDLRKLTIKPIYYYIKDSQKIIKFFTYGRFDTSINENQIVIGSNYIKFNRKMLLKETNGRRVLY